MPLSKLFCLLLFIIMFAALCGLRLQVQLALGQTNIDAARENSYQ